jgi:hypothetical protein
MARKSKSGSSSSSKSNRSKSSKFPDECFDEGQRSKSGSSRSRGEVSGAAKATIDHDEIRRWAEERGGKPACVKGTENSKGCLLRIDFPGGAGPESLCDMDWDNFFEVFDSRKLAFLYQDEKKSGEPSTFNKLIDRNEAESGARGGRRSGARSTRSKSRKSSTRASTRGGKSRRSSSRSDRGRGAR